MTYTIPVALFNRGIQAGALLAVGYYSAVSQAMGVH